MDPHWVKRIFNWLKRIPPVVTVLGIAGTTPEESLVIFKGAGGDHAGANRGANGATM
jgi:hypothetical protein